MTESERSGPRAGQEIGGTAVTPTDLEAMHAGDYILRARGGELSRVPVEKTRLPRDAQGHTQRLGLVRDGNGTIYAAQHTLIHRSADGGRTWEHLQRDPTPFGTWRLQFDDQGAMITVGQSADDAGPTVWSSRDEGETWAQIGEIEVDAPGRTSLGFSTTRLDDGALLVPLVIGAEQIGGPKGASPKPATCRVYRSTDGGRTWPDYSILGDWCCEVNIAPLPSGRLLAAIRYQRPRLPEDTPELFERTGAAASDSPFPYKHVFVAHSDDQGLSWTPPRQLAADFGQCYGSGVGLSRNRAVVVCDHRYPREMGSARARVSHDRGESWADEMYYLNHGHAAGYAATLSLDGEEMLTLTGSCYGDVESWKGVIGRTDFALIRWRLAG